MTPLLWGGAAIGTYLLFKQRPLPGTPGAMGPADQVPANGVAPGGSGGILGGIQGQSSSLGSTLDSAFGLGAKLDAGVATGICTYYTGGAGAPACRVAGNVVSKVNEFQRKETIKVAKFAYSELKPAAAAVGGAIKDGAVSGFQIGKQAVTGSPVAAVSNLVELSNNKTAGAIHSVDRVASSALGKLPTPIAAPAQLALGIADKTASAGAALANKGAAAAKSIESGVKSAGNAVANTGKKAVNAVLGWL